MKKMLIIGAGFAGLRLARKLSKHDFEIWLVDKNNYYLFQPLLYQIATAGLEPSSISFPLRKVFQNKKNVHIRCAEVLEVNTNEKKVLTSIGNITYDYLVIATGAVTNFFGNQMVEQHALPMKSVSQALYLRNHLLQNFEDALIAPQAEQEALLNVVVVGAGPTGVEVSGALAEMKKNILPKDYHEIDFSRMHIYLVEAGAKTLGSMSEEASLKSKEYLRHLGVNVMTGINVTAYDGTNVSLSNGQSIRTKTLIWAAGVKGSLPAGVPAHLVVRGNRISVDRQNRVLGSDHVFAIGDVAHMVTDKYPNGHPQVATVANEQADLLAKNFVALVQGRPVKDFEYSNKGSMATVGRHLAVVDLPGIKFQGFLAWLFWMALHLMLILGVKNKLLVFLNWMWKYFTFDQSLRLIIKPYKK